MKKFIKVLPILILAAFLAACGNREAEPDERITDLLREKEDIIDELQNRIEELESDLALGSHMDCHTDDYIDQEAVIGDFLENNIDWVADFLGIPDLYLAREDIWMDGSFIVAQSSFIIENDVQLIFEYNAWAGWQLLRYQIQWISGPGDLDGGRSVWQWGQEELFDTPFIARFYSFWDWDADGYIYDVVSGEIYPAGWQEQVIALMAEHTGAHINHIWYEGSRLVADLKPAPTIFFNWGSHGGYMHTLSLISSLASLPNVDEIEILVGGQRGLAADHFSFAGVFRINQ